MAAAFSLLILQDVRGMVLYASLTNKQTNKQRNKGMGRRTVSRFSTLLCTTAFSCPFFHSNEFYGKFASCELVNYLELVFGLDIKDISVDFSMRRNLRRKSKTDWKRNFAAWLILRCSGRCAN